MEQYILMREDGAYVARPGQEKSYTRDLVEAWVFRSREEAEKNRCVENERVVRLRDLLGYC